MLLTLAQDGFQVYHALLLLVVMAIVFGVFNVAVSTFLGRKREEPEKGIAYESGMNPTGTARRRFNVRFYIVAMTFLVFDVEIIFLYPWAVTFASLAGPEGEALQPIFLGRVLFFILTTVIAFIYAWHKGIFRYD